MTEGYQKSVPKVNAQSGVPTIATAVVGEHTGTLPVITPAPRPKLTFGETVLYAMVFQRPTEARGAALKISVKEDAKVELIHDSLTQYTLKIFSARVASPIFLTPQLAPQDTAPFNVVSISEFITPKNPVDLIAKIELSRPAELLLIKSSGELIIVAK